MLPSIVLGSVDPYSTLCLPPYMSIHLLLGSVFSLFCLLLVKIFTHIFAIDSSELCYDFVWLKELWSSTFVASFELAIPSKLGNEHDYLMLTWSFSQSLSYHWFDPHHEGFQTLDIVISKLILRFFILSTHFLGFQRVISFLIHHFESLIEQVVSCLISFSSHKNFECTLFGFFLLHVPLFQTLISFILIER